MADIDLKERWLRWGKRIALLMIFLFLDFIITNLLYPLPGDKLRPPVSKVVLDRDGKSLRVFLASDEMWRMPVSGDEIPKPLKHAVLNYEDRYFHYHPGVNPISLLRAAGANFRAGRIVQGGSTITMQLARLMEPKERTIKNKLVEIFRSFQLELAYSKEEILTLYLNMAPYGGNIVGVGAASRLYFDKTPSQLSLGESAMLVAIPKSPNVLRPDLNPQAARDARTHVLVVLKERGSISAEEMVEALSEPTPDRRFSLPFKTPHLSNLLHRRYPEENVLRTTVDSRIQELAESALSTHLAPLKSKGITNGAVVIIENETRNVLAMVGSVDFSDDQNSGQVNGATSPRSPGSALKPFIYALAIDDGMISPRSLLHDVPVDYSGYEPVNYDGIYNGAVSVEEALTRSLNVPAVRLYAELKDKGIYHFLKNAGVSSLGKDKNYYGLSLILGGFEISLTELTNLYAGLASGGSFRGYRLLEDGSRGKERQLFTKETAYVLTDMLSRLRRPELPEVWEFSAYLPKVAWKTGTSYGHRDAWSVGSTPDYTVGVWIGNFSGEGAPGIVGAEAAAPVMFTIFNALLTGVDASWFEKPAGVGVREVCAVSGMPAGDLCEVKVEELFIPGSSPHEECTVHRKFLVDVETGERLCSHCRLGRDYEKVTFEIWSAEIATWMGKNGIPIDRIPVHNPECSKIAEGDGPVIRSPSASTDYVIRRGVELKYQKILLDASVSNQTESIYWFFDGELIYSGEPGARVFITPSPGTHSLICMDDEGRSSEIAVKITEAGI